VRVMKKISAAILAPTLLFAGTAWGQAPAYPVASQAEIEAAADLCYASTAIPGPVDTAPFVAAGWTERSVPQDMKASLGDRVFKKGDGAALIGLVTIDKLNGCKVISGMTKDLNRVGFMQHLDALYKAPRSSESTAQMGQWVWLAHMARSEFIDFKDFSLVTIFVTSSKLN
jgi:hypothetical protein